MGLAPADVRMGVAVPRFVAADAAGVVFTRDPVDGADRAVVEAVRGAGEALVSGRATPDRWTVPRDGAPARDGGGAEPCLADADVSRVADLARQVETALGAPQDVEWVLSGGELHLVQARPITARVTAAMQAQGIGPEERQVWSNTNIGELVPDVATPMTFWTAQLVIRDLLGPLLQRLGLPDDLPITGLVAGRIYVNMNAAVAVFRRLPGLKRRGYADYFGGDREAIAAALARLEDSDLPVVRVSGWRTVLRVPGFLWWVLGRAGLHAEPVVARLASRTAALGAVDPVSLPDEAIVARVEELLVVMRREPEGFALAMVGVAAAQLLAAACRRWLDDSDGAIAARLLSGVGGLDSAEAGLALWRLSEAARPVRQVVCGRARWSKTRAILRESDDGRAFLDQWDWFLHRHGHHTRAEVDVAVPRWSEQPDYVLGQVRAYLADEGGRSPVELHAQRAREAAALAADCRRRLGPLRRIAFRMLLDRARRGLILRETAKSGLVKRIALARATLAEAGRRLASRGLVREPDDVFFLLGDELPDALAGRRPELRSLVAARRLAYERNRLACPPPVVAGRFEPAPPPPAEVPADRVLRGVAVSPGIAVGQARVILRSDADDHVRPGEILVAPFTDPGWTPYFLPAAGIVMDLGGVLSHGSVVAREYGIPAVVNVGTATRVVRTGQWVRVDALRGEVHLLDGPPQE